MIDKMGFLGTIVLFCVVAVEGTLVFDGVTYDTASTAFWNETYMDFVVVDFDITARAVNFDGFSKCDEYQGAIVFTDYAWGVDRLGEKLRECGAVALVMGVPLLGSGGFSLDHPRRTFYFPSLELFEDDLRTLASNIQSRTVPINVTVVSDPAPTELFDRYLGQSMFMNVFFGILYVCIFFSIFYHFVIEVRDHGASGGIRFYIGVLLLVVTLLRLGYLIFDPLLRYRIVTYKFQGTCYTINFLLSILGMAMVTVYWLEVMNKGIVQIPALNNIKLPYYVMILVYCVILVFILVMLFADNTEINDYIYVFLALLALTFLLMSVFSSLLISL
eukprot:TRINITY_DN549_c0_g1_i2.p1 TRINITY_DN549_c0_g1~~TRINITY_DN549_c0_g1_i2.p1  ORF type:complete len:338 (+),score=47.77 TRINITY_DN549_c0_g1_i2:22-1014(+)